MGLDADADDGEIALDTAAARGCHGGLDPLFALKPRESLVAEKLDAVLLMDRSERTADLGSRDSLSGTFSPKTAVTRTPSCVSEAATSLPMKPMPRTTARRPSAASRLIASHWATVRS